MWGSNKFEWVSSGGGDLDGSYSGTFFAARSIPKNAFMGHQGSSWLLLGAFRDTQCRKITCLPEGSSYEIIPSLNGADMGVDTGDCAITLELQNHPSERHCLFVINVGGKGENKPVTYSVFSLNDDDTQKWIEKQNQCNGIFEIMTQNGQVLLFEDCMLFFLICLFVFFLCILCCW